MRRRLLLIAVLAVAGAALAGYRVYQQRQPHTVVGSPTVEFDPNLEPGAKPRADPVAQRLPWPTYAFDAERTHFGAGVRLRPPFRRLWKVFADWSFIEFPPVVGYGRLYLGTNHGRMLSIDARSGRIAWHREFGRCIAASPTLGRGVVYVPLMGRIPCTHASRHSDGLLAALDAKTGRLLWSFRAGAVESSPLLVHGLVYFGSWDDRVYAVDVRTHRPRWAFRTGAEVKGGVALAGGTVYAGSYDGRVYALDARSGRLRWSAGAERGLTGVSLLGLGFGGWIAAEMATMAPAAFRRLVLVGAMGILPAAGEILDQALVSYIDYARAGFADQAAFDRLFGADPPTPQRRDRSPGP